MTGEFRHVFTFSLNCWKKSTRSALSKCCRPSATLFTCHFYFVWPMESKEKPEQKCFLVNCLPCSSETSVGGYESVAFGLQSSTTADVSLQTTRGHVSIQSISWWSYSVIITRVICCQNVPKFDAPAPDLCVVMLSPRSLFRTTENCSTEPKSPFSKITWWRNQLTSAGFPFFNE